MSQLQALIFDVDGTLAETEDLHRRAFNEAFVAAGLPWSWDQPLYGRLLEVTGGKERIRHYIDAYAATPALNTATIAALHADKTTRYAAMIEQGDIALRPGIAAILGAASGQGIRLAIATTTSRPNVDALLRATLQKNPFEVIAAGDEVRAKKPAPDIYTLALARLGLDARNCVAIEDTLNGLRSAQSAGLACIVTPSVYGGTGPFPGALKIVEPGALAIASIAAWLEP
jgi:HAD superfamily hydrolase (TIGR01509 family)